MPRPRFRHCFRCAAEKFGSCHKNDADVIFAAGFVGSIDEHLRDAGRLAVVLLDNGADFSGRQNVAETVGA